jgi:hypothetical protein
LSRVLRTVRGHFPFAFSVVKNKNNIIGWALLVHFNLVAANNPSNYAMLLSIQQLFNVSKIVYFKDKSYIRYFVNGLKDCLIIKEHFIQNPLLIYKL